MKIKIIWYSFTFYPVPICTKVSFCAIFDSEKLLPNVAVFTSNCACPLLTTLSFIFLSTLNYFFNATFLSSKKLDTLYMCLRIFKLNYAQNIYMISFCAMFVFYVLFIFTCWIIWASPKFSILTRTFYKFPITSWANPIF